jgi:hypothetical protein
MSRIRHTRSWILHIINWEYALSTIVTPPILVYDKSIINFVQSTVLQKPQLISYEHLHAGYVSSINKAQTVTTDRLRRKTPDRRNEN